jgi:hypothetical protein
MIGGRAGGQTAQEAVSELSTRSLAQLLAGRFRQRIRRARPR